MLWLSIISFKTFPAPTEGSWSLSPTIINLVLEDKASVKCFINIISTIDISSIIKTSQSSGFSEFLAKQLPTSSTPGVISKRRWMVLASNPQTSLILFAALPVGAANITLLCSIFIALIIVFIIVVFPVPGPPVITKAAVWKARLTASLWFSLSSILSSLSTLSIKPSIWLISISNVTPDILISFSATSRSAS